MLTKWLGTGIVGTAIKNGRAPDDLVAHAVASMTMFNRAAADVLRQSPAPCTAPPTSPASA